jgi:D-aminopeptidase
MKRIARRAALGLGRTGSYAANGSGDIFVAFSTANSAALQGKPLADSSSIGNGHLDPFFAATVEATEEAIANALVAARDMQGMNGHVVRALPHDMLLELLKRHGRYQAPN